MENLTRRQMLWGKITGRRQLPWWVKYDMEADELLVNIDKLFPKVLDALGKKADQYWKQVLRRCVGNYLRRELFNHPIHLRLTGSREVWHPSKLPPGDGEERGIEEFRLHYDRVVEILKEVKQ